MVVCRSFFYTLQTAKDIDSYVAAGIRAMGIVEVENRASFRIRRLNG